jgi:digeranylgeranylglycerophospholipid reductase
MAKNYDLAIVGAGFAGLVCARSAALRGLRTLVLERQPRPGFRIHTTGLLVKEVAERWEAPPRLTRRIRGVRIYGPSLASIDLESPGYYFLATDTPRLMAWLAREAGHAGAYLKYGATFSVVNRDEDRISLPGCDAVARYLIGADGPHSRVARVCNLGRNSEFLIGVEAEVTGLRGLEPDRLHCFLDARMMPGYIGWAFIGVGGVAQVGLACRRPTRPDLDAFMARLGRVCDIDDAQVIGRRGGLIPVGGRVAPFGRDNVMLIGDAAGIVSPLTAGGIHTALDSGWRAGHAVADHLLDRAPAPHLALDHAFPRFFWKRRLRELFDFGVPNWLIDVGLGTSPLRAFAQAVYFHNRGLLSARAWGGLLTGERRKASGQDT